MFRIFAAILITAIIILLAIMLVDLADTNWSVFGQGLVNTTVTPSGTPSVNVPQPIATTQDLNSQFNTFVTGLTGTVAAAGGGIGALWAKFRGKAKRIDNALRAQDFDTKDLFDLINALMVAGKENPTITWGEVVSKKAYPDRKLNDQTIHQAWGEQFEEYNEWFTKRYVENPE